MLVIYSGFGEIVKRCEEKIKKDNLRLSYAYAVYASQELFFLAMNT